MNMVAFSFSFLDVFALSEMMAPPVTRVSLSSDMASWDTATGIGVLTDAPIDPDDVGQGTAVEIAGLLVDVVDTPVVDVSPLPAIEMPFVEPGFDNDMIAFAPPPSIFPADVAEAVMFGEQDMDGASETATGLSVETPPEVPPADPTFPATATGWPVEVPPEVPPGDPSGPGTATGLPWDLPPETEAGDSSSAGTSEHLELPMGAGVFGSFFLTGYVSQDADYHGAFDTLI